MRFQTHIRDWEQMAADPFWAVLTGKLHWDTEEFFATAEPEVRDLLAVASRLNLPRHRTRALDFGCGVGRVTRQLSQHFQECWGVDISRTMLRLAEQYSPECHFHQSHRRDLSEFPDSHFDLVHSVLVLQHQPDRRTVEGYIRELIRVLDQEGLLAFQLPSKIPLRYRLAPRRRAYRLLHAAGVGQDRLRQWKLFPMRMIAMPPAAVKKVIESSGADLLLVETHGGSGAIPSVMYYCTKKQNSVWRDRCAP
jgi:trans-aconitate methyltransferase